MKFFNIDLHVSVIEDVATQFRALGHDVESHLLSGHAWALGRERASRGTGEGTDGKIGYGSVNLATWDGLFNDAPEFAVARAWQDENPQLESFDGFIATYPTAFALLYERFRGRVITHIPVRYELGFTHDAAKWRAYNDRLRAMQDSDKLAVVANNQYDAIYYTYFTGRRAEHISSTCDYVDRHAPKWCPRGPKMLAFGEHVGCREAVKHVPDLLFVRDALGDYYRHDEISRARAIVWIPYTSSIMSFFEHYWLCIPLLVPSQKFLFELWEKELALSQLSWHKSMTGGSALPPYDATLKLLDPHTREGMMLWMDFYDFYNDVELPHVTHFDSWTDLRDKVAAMDHESISQAMAAHNKLRRASNLNKWRAVLAG